jgi:hypothetical protein
MTKTEQALLNYTPLTSETRVEDFELPTHLTIGGRLVELPKCITRKDPHFLLNTDGSPVRASWISKPLAHILNGMRFENTEIKLAELQRALAATEESISTLIKSGVLKDKKGPGAMAFCQANENVHKDSILISSRTFDTLCLINKKWKNARTVAVTRFPNLGPGTTQELKLVVDKAKGVELLADLPETSLGKRFANLEIFLKAVEEETVEDILDCSGVVDAFYLHPETLKEKFEGDGDGDLLFIKLQKYGEPKFKKVNLNRNSGEISQDDVDVLFKKASRTERTNIKEWLPTYFDDVPIGDATYVVRWMLYNQLKNHKDSDHPMHEAWKEVSPKAIELVEFVMDIRKGDWTDDEIDKKMKGIKNKMFEISKAKESGNWFAKTVTTKSVDDIPGFIQRFSTLQEYMNAITMQKDQNLMK